MSESIYTHTYKLYSHNARNTCNWDAQYGKPRPGFHVRVCICVCVYVCVSDMYTRYAYLQPGCSIWPT